MRYADLSLLDDYCSEGLLFAFPLYVLLLPEVSLPHPRLFQKLSLGKQARDHSVTDLRVLASSQ